MPILKESAFYSENSVTATKLYKDQTNVKSRERDTLIEQSPRAKKVYNNIILMLK